MSAKIYYLWFDPEDGCGGRYHRGEYGLHCGDGLKAKIKGEWVETRVEHSHSSTHSGGWYLVTHPNQPLEGLPVMKEEA